MYGWQKCFYAVYKHGEKKSLTFLELFQVFVLCRSESLDVLIVEIHLYFASLSFLLHMPCEFALELPLLHHLALPGKSQSPPLTVLLCTLTFLVLSRQNRTHLPRWHFLISD